MKMEKQDHGAQCEQLRESMEVRAALIYYFVKAARDMGVDYVTLGRKAMFDNGVYKAKTTFHPAQRVDVFSKEYMKPETLEAFDGKITVCEESCMVEQSTYCPLVACWQKLTDDEKFIEELCDIAMCGDRGILSCYPQFQFTLLGTIFDEGGKCQVKVGKKEDEK